MEERWVRRLIRMLAAIALFFVAAAVVQWLWNNIVPWVIGFPPVTYWQGAGLLLLSWIFFGGPARVFAGARHGGCSCREKDGEVSGHFTSSRPLRRRGPLSKSEYIARSRAFLSETDDTDIP